MIKMRVFAGILFILLLSAGVPIAAFCQPFFFRHYEVESGLSNNAIICSVQDRLGFMWFGTRDGVNRFDGHAFKTYRFGNNNTRTSGNNFIRSLNIDVYGTLLLATDKEIYKYNSRLDTFTLLLSPRYFIIEKIVTDRHGNIWFIADGLLNKYSVKTRSLKVYERTGSSFISGICIDKKDQLWVSATDGFLKKYNESNDTFLSFDMFAKSDKTLPRNIHLIESGENNTILVGTDKAGFKIFDQNTSTYSDIPLCCENLDKLFIRSILQVSPEEVWIGTEDGMFIYTKANGASSLIRKNSSDSYAISDNVIYTIYKDREGGTWVGTYFGGLNYYPRQFTPFHKFYKKPYENSLSGNIVREITEDKWGNLWIAVEDAGLAKLEVKTGSFIHYKPDQGPGSISYIGVHDLLAVGNELWVGTYEHGLDVLDIKTGKVIRHYGASPANGLRSNFPFCMMKTKEGEIIVGATAGIYTYRRQKDYFEPIPGMPSEWYMCIMKDSRGTLWGGVPGKGVFYMNTRTGISGNFRFNPADITSISSDKVNSLFEDSRKNLWFLTENGLCKLNRNKGNFKRYGFNNGFASNFMLAMLEDEKGLLWISTTKGLACFDPVKEKAKVYTTANGLLSNQFNFSSGYKNNEGRMFFGSAKGLISFHPAELTRDAFVPPVYLTSLEIDNQEVSIAQSGSPLKQSISFTSKVVLNYDQSTFSIDFAALGYTAPDNLDYKYVLEGLSDTWTLVKRPRRASFTKLKPGKYLFKVKASSTGGVWSEKETRLAIEVLPPWWASRWAYLAYTVLGALIIYSIFQYYRKRLEEKNRRKIELLEIAQEKEIMRMEIAKEKEMLEAKIEFFTEVAHEIRTPLTLIKIPLATVQENTIKTPVIETCLEIMEKNTDRLIELSNQLLDFRETEIKGYSLSFEKADITRLLKDAHLSFAALGAKNNIEVSLQSGGVPLLASVDVDAFNKIIYNLCSNAVKYAASFVSISLKTPSVKDNTFTIRIENDGPSIPDHLKEKIFEPFYRIKETESKTGTGIGLALARSLTILHGGELQVEASSKDVNVFVLTLPVQNHIPNS